MGWTTRRPVRRKSSATRAAVLAALLAALVSVPQNRTSEAPVPRAAPSAARAVARHAPDEAVRESRALVHRATRGARPRPAPRPKGDPLLVPFGPLTERHLAELRGCENGGSYVSAPGDRYRGGYQAFPDTWRRIWRRLGRPAYAALDPAAASRRVQDAFARWLHRICGRGQWPRCGRSLP